MAPCEKRISFLSVFPHVCLSRACLGKTKWVIVSIKTAQKMRFPYFESLDGLSTKQIASFVRKQLFLGDACPEPVVVN